MKLLGPTAAVALLLCSACGGNSLEPSGTDEKQTATGAPGKGSASGELCGEETHAENGVCVGNGKTTDCNANAEGLPGNASWVLEPTEVSWDSESRSWREPADCSEWVCRPGYEERSGQCDRATDENWFEFSPIEETAPVFNATFAFDGNQTPYLAYQVHNRKIVVKKFNAEYRAWEELRSPGDQPTHAGKQNDQFRFGLAVGRDNQPVIAFAEVNERLRYRLSVRAYDGRAWSYLGGAQVSKLILNGPNDADILSINAAFDNENRLYVAFNDIKKVFEDELTGEKRFSYRVFVLRYDSAAHRWRSVGAAGDGDTLEPITEEGQTVYGKDVALAIDNQGVPYIAFGDGGQEYGVQRPAQVALMRFVDGAWRRLGTAGEEHTCPLDSQMNLQLDAAGTPFVAFKKIVDTESEFGRFAQVVRLEQETNQLQLIGDIGSSYPTVFYNKDINMISLAIGSSPFLAIAENATYEATSYSMVGLYAYENGEWEKIREIEGYFNIAVGAAEQPFIAYKETTESTRLHLSTAIGSPR